MMALYGSAYRIWRSIWPARCAAPGLTLLCFVLLPLLSVHAAPIGGTLTGKVVMKTAGAPLPNTPLTVTLLYVNPGLFRDEAAAESRTTTTAADGSFSFSGLDTTAAGVYRVIAQYKGIAYEPDEHPVTADTTGGAGTSRAVRFASNATTVTTEVPIYEPIVSDNPATLQLKSDQIIINEVRPQFYGVLEAIQVTNPGDRTLVGALNPDGSAAMGVPVVFSVPATATAITTNRIDLIPGADLTGTKLTLRAPLQPGANDIVTTYNLPGSSSGLTFTRALDYAAPKVQVLVSDARQAIFSRTLHDDGPIQTPQGTTAFRQFSLDNVQAGQTIDLTVGPSPTATAQSAAAPKKGLFTRAREQFTVPILLVLAAICLVLMFLILRTPVRSTDTPHYTAASDDAREPSADTDDDAQPIANAQEAKTSGGSRRRVRGRPHDYDVDEADRAIEEANRPDDADERDDERR